MRAPSRFHCITNSRQSLSALQEAHLADRQASCLQIIEEEAREREDVASMNAEELRKFDQELEARAKQRDIDMGRRWKP